MNTVNKTLIRVRVREDGTAVDTPERVAPPKDALDDSVTLYRSVLENHP